MPKSPSLPLLACALLAGAASALSTPALALDPADRDGNIAACTDFYQHANGGWLTRHPVPAGRGSISRFDQLKATSLQQQRELLDGMAVDGGGSEAMLATFWRAAWTRPESRRRAPARWPRCWRRSTACDARATWPTRSRRCMRQACRWHSTSVPTSTWPISGRPSPTPPRVGWACPIATTTCARTPRPAPCWDAIAAMCSACWR
ncbi:M13 family metallopeptidase [Alkalisalibacterium limincola]|uniref:M13 family metallopeptidase n=1 Tax=Alkalisalibacterium limincola TaxID=2699169 RepID=A0A5C8KKF3_9GAMM|nr:M13 family metallopeptidase [Alkalisalibacterium limincola]